MRKQEADHVESGGQGTPDSISGMRVYIRFGDPIFLKRAAEPEQSSLGTSAHSRGDKSVRGFATIDTQSSGKHRSSFSRNVALVCHKRLGLAWRDFD